MNPYTLIEKLAADHMLAWRFTLTMLNQMLAEVLPEHRLSGIANLSVGDNDEIDVYIDPVAASTLHALHQELSAERVKFCAIDVDERPASLVGRVDGVDRLKIFVDGRSTLRFAVLDI